MYINPENKNEDSAKKVTEEKVLDISLKVTECLWGLTEDPALIIEVLKNLYASTLTTGYKIVDKDKEGFIQENLDSLLKLIKHKIAN